MKVLHIGKYYPPFSGGIERVNYDLVENLNLKEDCAVDELCFNHMVNKRMTEYPVRYKLFRVTTRAIRASTPISFEYFSIYKKIRHNYDIIHIHLPNPWAAMAPLMFPSQAKIVLHWHSDILKQKTLKTFYRPFQTLLLKRATKIIVTSRNYFEASEDLHPYREKVTVVPIGINPDYLGFQHDDLKKIQERYAGKRIVLSIGRLTYYKGFDYLIDAARRLPEDVVVLIGGCGELHDELQERIKTNDLEERVRLIGRIPSEKIGAYYSAADLFCLPSIVRTEAFGVVLIEAMSMGLPIVACNIPGSGVNWVNSDKETGLNVPVCDSQALAEAIQKLLDPSVRKIFSDCCKKRYEALFTRDKMVNDVYNLYCSILSSTINE